MKLEELLKNFSGEEKLNQIIQAIKQIHPKTVVGVKAGKFIKVEGKDAIIISELMDYKLQGEEPLAYVGFPESSLLRVCSALDSKKIDYLFVDKRVKYAIIEREEFKKLNKYDEYFKKVLKYSRRKKKIHNINVTLLVNVRNDEIDDILEKMEELIYEI